MKWNAALYGNPFKRTPGIKQIVVFPEGVRPVHVWLFFTHLFIVSVKTVIHDL